MSKEKRVVALFKFGKSERIQRLYNEGELYLNTVYYFKNLEDKNLRGDKDESITQNWQSSRTEVVINGRHLKDVVGPIKFYFPQEDRHQFTNIFSMTALCIGDEVNDDKIFDDRIKGFGDEAIIIFDPKKFFLRLSESAKNLADEGNLQYFKGNIVKYFDFNTYHGDLDIFGKSQEYSWQKEWRLGVRSLNHLDPFLLKIGSLKDIAEVVKIEDFFNGKIKISFAAKSHQNSF